MTYEVYLADCQEWLINQPRNSFHAIITDPPYGIKEYTEKELEKRKSGHGGIWRIPPRIGGSQRAPLPRFTVLTKKELDNLHNFFNQWGRLALSVLVPGGHLFIASNPLVLQIVSSALTKTGFECRGSVVRLVRTLKGGFRPKLAENEFSNVCSMPRSCWEPWGIFRKPLNGRLRDNLKLWMVGGLRRNPDGTPFVDVIPSERTPLKERRIAPHPSLKPQSFLRRLVWASLPLGKGRILDPFCGAGSTLAAAESLGYESVGIEINPEYVEMAKVAIPKLAKLPVDLWQPKFNRVNNTALSSFITERF